MPKSKTSRDPMADPAYKTRRVYGPKEYIQRGDSGSVDVEVHKGVPNNVDKDSHPSSSITKKARQGKPVRKKYSSDLNSQVTPGEWKTK